MSLGSSRTLPSEGKGHKFESCRARHCTFLREIVAETRARTHQAADTRTQDLLPVASDYRGSVLVIRTAARL